MAIGYIENFSNELQASNGWQDKDLSPGGLPDDAICDFIAQNGRSDFIAGVSSRKDGSALDRRVNLSNARAGGSMNMGHCCLNTDVAGSNRVQMYRSHDTALETSKLFGWFLGQSPEDYVELFASVVPLFSGGWDVVSLIAAGVPPGKIAQIFLAHSETTSNLVLGARKIGSTVERKYDVAQSRNTGGTGWHGLSLWVEADGNQDIELWSDDDTKSAAFILGYWDFPPATYFIEQCKQISANPTPGLFTTRNLSSVGLGADDLAVVAFGRDNTPGPENMGCREVGSVNNRILPMDVTLGSGRSWTAFHALADASSQIQLMQGDLSAQVMYLDGAWSEEPAPVYAGGGGHPIPMIPFWVE